MQEPPAGIDVKGMSAMLNLDMVGRWRSKQLTVLDRSASHLRRAQGALTSYEITSDGATG